MYISIHIFIQIKRSSLLVVFMRDYRNASLTVFERTVEFMCADTNLHLYACIYLSICIYIYVCIYLYIYLSMYLSLYAYLYLYLYLYISIFSACMYVCLYVCMYACLLVCFCFLLYLCIYEFMWVCIIHVCTCALCIHVCLNRQCRSWPFVLDASIAMHYDFVDRHPRTFKASMSAPSSILRELWRAGTRSPSIVVIVRIPK